MVTISRAIVDEHGRFRGIVSASMLPACFSEILHPVTPDPGSTTLVIDEDPGVIAGA
jgi:hypothetical protein